MEMEEEEVREQVAVEEVGMAGEAEGLRCQVAVGVDMGRRGD